MSHPDPMDREEVEARFRRAGVALTKEQIDELHSVSGYVRRISEEVNRPRPKEAEPAVIYARQPK